MAPSTRAAGKASAAPSATSKKPDAAAPQSTAPEDASPIGERSSQPEAVNAASASAAQPAKKCLALEMLNKASARAGGRWEVIVFHPIVDEYEYSYAGKRDDSFRIPFRMDVHVTTA